MPELDTARLHLRMFRESDLDDLSRLLSDPAVVKYVGDGLPISREDSERALYSMLRHWQQHGFGRWVAIDKATESFVGCGGLRSLMGVPEVVYHLAPESWGRGFATELAKATVRFGFEERGFERIVAVAKPENVASINVMTKAGMLYDRHTTYYNIHVVQYHINRDQYQPDSSPYAVLSD